MLLIIQCHVVIFENITSSMYQMLIMMSHDLMKNSARWRRPQGEPNNVAVLHYTEQQIARLKQKSATNRISTTPCTSRGVQL